MAAVRDKEYFSVVERERPLLQACGYLLTGDGGRADRLVDLVLARMYERWHDVRTPRVEALRALIESSPYDPQLPWDTQDRFQLIDSRLTAPPAVPIVADLQRLPAEQRAVLVLERYAELPSVQIAAIVGRTVDEVLLLARHGQAALITARPDRADAARLAEELREAVPLDRRTPYDAVADLAHGRQLVRRRWLRRGLTTAATVVLLVATVMMLIPDRKPAPVAAPAPASTTTPTSHARCDVAQPVCRAEILRVWRGDMANVVQSHIDPRGKGYGYRFDERYDTSGLWTGDGGALALEMFRLDKGGTVVYLQIATSSRTAVTCGQTTHHSCHDQTFLSGNTFALTETSTVEEGMEVQYRLIGRVITVIARTTARGEVWEVPRGDLIALADDPRLELPAI